MRTSKLLLGTTLGLCFASSANAASFAPVNTEFTLTGGITLTDVFSNRAAVCSVSLIGTTDGAGNATITDGVLSGVGDCSLIEFAGFPWSMTAASASSINLTGFQVYAEYPYAYGFILSQNAVATYNNSGTLSAAFSWGVFLSGIVTTRLTVDTMPVLSIVP
ncbi:MAG: hypothetical protein ACREO8_14205 [Luteimonas sp.]